MKKPFRASSSPCGSEQAPVIAKLLLAWFARRTVASLVSPIILFKKLFPSARWLTSAATRVYIVSTPFSGRLSLNIMSNAFIKGVEILSIKANISK